MNGLRPAIPVLLLGGIIGTIGGALGTLLMRLLIPIPIPGDGWAVRWIDAEDRSVTLLSYGPDEAGALKKAIEIKARSPRADVAVVNVKQGIVTSIQKAGEPAVVA